MRMGWGFGENVLDNTLRQFASALILLQDNEHGHAGFEGGASLSVHKMSISPIEAREPAYRLGLEYGMHCVYNGSIAYNKKQATFSILFSPRTIKRL